MAQDAEPAVTAQRYISHLQLTYSKMALGRMPLSGPGMTLEKILMNACRYRMCTTFVLVSVAHRPLSYQHLYSRNVPSCAHLSRKGCKMFEAPPKGERIKGDLMTAKRISKESLAPPVPDFRISLMASDSAQKLQRSSRAISTTRR